MYCLCRMAMYPERSLAFLYLQLTPLLLCFDNCICSKPYPNVTTFTSIE